MPSVGRASSCLLLVALGCVDLQRPPELRDPRDGPGGDSGPVVGDGMNRDGGPEAPPPDGPGLANGATCSSDEVCSSAICVEGRCCDARCDGLCTACNIAGSEGQCVPVPAGEDPRNQCEPQPSEPCGRDGTCNGRGSCRLQAMGIQCAAGQCAGTM